MAHHLHILKFCGGAERPSQKIHVVQAILKDFELTVASLHAISAVYSNDLVHGPQLLSTK
jgi:hypothetical protein